LGSTVIRLLQNTDSEVYGLLLPEEKPVIKAPNIHYVHGDVCRKETLSPLFENADMKTVKVIHTAGIISIEREVSPLVYEVNVNGTKNMIHICREKEVDRFVYVSSVHAIPEMAYRETIYEAGFFSAASVVGGYAKTKAEATQSVLDASRKGLQAVIVHPSGIIGPYDKGNNHLVQLVIEYMNGKLEYRQNEVFYSLQLEFTLNKNPTAPDTIMQEISYATLADIPDWMNFITLVIDGFPCLDETSHLEQVKQYVQRRQALIMRDGSTIIGATTFSYQTGSIDFLAVHPQYRHYGVTKALANRFMYRVGDCGCIGSGLADYFNASEEMMKRAICFYKFGNLDVDIYFGQ